MCWRAVAGFLGVSERTLHRRIEYDIDSSFSEKKTGIVVVSDGIRR